MKKLITLSLLLIAFCSFGQTPTLNLTQDTPKGIYELKLQGTVPPVDSCKCKPGDDGKTPIVTTTYSVVPYNNPPKAINQPNAQGVNVHFELPAAPPQPSCPTCPPSGGGGSDNAVNKVFNVVAYGAKGDGVTDDWQAIQNALNAAIDAKGKLLIPPPPVRYRINRTLEASRDQFWLYVEMQARRGQGIVYMGPSGGAAIRINGQKGGEWRGIEAKIGDDSPAGQAIINSSVIEITAEGSASSTAGWSMYDCTFELNKGTGNVGVKVGRVANNNDISQIHFNNVTVWGSGAANGNSIAGQDGYLIGTATNICQLAWYGGGLNFLDHGIHLTFGTGFSVFGLGGSQNNIDFYFEFPSPWTIIPNRFESGKQHIVQKGGGYASIVEIGALVADYRPPTGRLFDMQTTCSLVLDGLKVEKTTFDQRCIYLGGGSGLGTLRVENGAWRVTSSDLLTVETPGRWSVRTTDVGKFDGDKVTSLFPNR